MELRVAPEELEVRTDLDRVEAVDQSVLGEDLFTRGLAFFAPRVL